LTAGEKLTIVSKLYEDETIPRNGYENIFKLYFDDLLLEMEDETYTTQYAIVLAMEKAI
jgi:hypothetical protein